MRRGVTPSNSASAVPRGASIGTASWRISSQVTSEAGAGQRLGGERLGAVHSRGMVRGGAERHGPEQPAHAGALGGAGEAPGGQPVDLLDAAARLVAGGAGEMDDGVHSAQGVAIRG